MLSSLASSFSSWEDFSAFALARFTLVAVFAAFCFFFASVFFARASRSRRRFADFRLALLRLAFGHLGFLAQLRRPLALLGRQQSRPALLLQLLVGEEDA